IREPPKLILRFGEPLYENPQSSYFASGNPYTSRKIEQRFIAESSLFSVGEVFAIAKVKLLCSEV
ncbi:MAG: hypothetical protein II984_06205, partial [Clostridia bacterium]|nr:hypothetical protein [Clostridia bacterium]